MQYFEYVVPFISVEKTIVKGKRLERANELLR